MYNGIVPRRLSRSVTVEPTESVVTAEPKLVEFPAPARTKNPAAVALGKLGGSKGGKIRAARLSQDQRTAIAQQAAKARWAKTKN